jgi:hypothetical protein
MLTLLLDEHISPEVAKGLRRLHKTFPVAALAEREQGRFLGQSDELLLSECASKRITLVTYDRRTIPPLLKVWAESNRDHGGVVFVDEKTIPPSDIGGLIRALLELHKQMSKHDWTNQIIFLRK